MQVCSVNTYRIPLCTQICCILFHFHHIVKFYWSFQLVSLTWMFQCQWGSPKDNSKICCGHLNTKMLSCQYGDSHYKDKTVSKPSYNYNGNPYALKDGLLYWDRAQVSNHNKICKGQIDGLVQERRNSIANTLELHLSCTNPSKSCAQSLRHTLHLNGQVQNRHNTLGLCLFSTNSFNTLRPRQNGHFQMHFLEWKCMNFA